MRSVPMQPSTEVRPGTAADVMTFDTSECVTTLVQYLHAVDECMWKWTADKLRTLPGFPQNRTDYAEMAKVAWFRGHAQGDWLLRPKLYRSPSYDHMREVAMNLDCRREARTLAGVPPMDDYPAWLSLMQHHGLPTRLLDWTESAAAALFFAVEAWREYERWMRSDWFTPAVWMMNPHAFNWVSVGGTLVPGPAADEAYGNEQNRSVAWGRSNILPAFGIIPTPTYPTPMAVKPDYVHTRMQVQRSRFTVHGSRTDGIQDMFVDTELVQRKLLYCIGVEPKAAPLLLEQLRRVGVSRSTLFPDLEGVAGELGERFQQQAREAGLLL